MNDDLIERKIFDIPSLQLLLDRAFTRMGQGWMEPTTIHLSLENYMDLLESLECDKRLSHEHSVMWYHYSQFKIPIHHTQLLYTVGVHWRQLE